MTYDAQHELGMAILQHQPEAFAMALARGAQLDQSGAAHPTEQTLVAGEQMVFQAMVTGSTKLLDIAEKQGLDVTPYFKRVRLEHLPGDCRRSSKVLRFLLKRWPDTRWKEPLYESGNTLLHAMANVGNGRNVKALAELGVPLDTRNGQGQTALHVANNRIAIKALLDAKANRVVLDNRGHTPLMVAVTRLMGTLRRHSGAGSITERDLYPTWLLSQDDGVLSDPKADVVARRLDKLRKAGVPPIPTVPMEQVWTQVEEVLAGQRRKRLGKVVKSSRGRVATMGRAL